MLLGNGLAAHVVFTLLSLASCSEVQVTHTPPDIPPIPQSGTAQLFRNGLSDALAKGVPLKSLSPVHTSILRALGSPWGPSQSLLDFICEDCGLGHLKVPETSTPSLWAGLVESSFRRFFQTNQAEAQAVLELTVIPSHPVFSKEPSCLPKMLELFEGGAELVSLADSISSDILAARLYQVLASPDTGESHSRFMLLLHQFSLAFSWKDPSYKYVYSFMLNVGLEDFGFTMSQVPSGFEKLFESPQELAPEIYATMTRSSFERAEKAQNALERVLPDISQEGHLGKPYEKMIALYVKSGLEPVDLEHLKSSISKTLTSPEVSSKLSPAHLSILSALQREEEVEACQAFLCHLFRNYWSATIKDDVKNPCFWRTLIFSSFSQLATARPVHAQHLAAKIAQSEELSKSGAAQGSQHALFTAGMTSEVSEMLETIILAANCGHIETIKHLIASQVSFITTNHSLKSLVLVNAAWYGHMEIVKLFVEMGVDPSGRHGMALAVASMGGYYQIVRYLVEEKGLNPNLNGCCALASAALGGRMRIIEYLVEKGANPRSKQGKKATVLAAACGHVNVLEYFFSRGIRHSARHFRAAIRGGHLEVVQYMIERTSFDPNNMFYPKGLCIAAENGHVDIVRYLLSKQSQLSYAEGRLAFTLAAQNGHTDVMIELAAKTTGQLQGFFDGEEALVRAAKRGHTGTVKYLVMGGVDPDARHGLALACAAEKNFTDIVSCLLQGGANVSIAFKTAKSKGYKNAMVLLQSHDATLAQQHSEECCIVC